MTDTEPEIVSLAEETLKVDKRDVLKGRVRVRTETEEVEELARISLQGETVEITRIAIDKFVSEPPPVRSEGDVTIVPVVEEVAVIEKRLVLKEELHIRRTSSTTEAAIPVTLRKQHAIVEHETLGATEATGEDHMADTLNTIQTRTITAFFDNKADADDAVDALVAAGIPNASIRQIAGNEGGAETGTREQAHRGFFAALADLFMPDEDRYSYAEGLSRGGYLVTVTNLTDATHDQAVDILDDEGAVNLDEREAGWREEGWQGYNPDNSYADNSYAGTASAAAAGTETAGTRAPTSYAELDTNRRATNLSGNIDEDVIPVVKEELLVGKRDVDLGRVRVRSYVREEPVSEQVNLHDERVTLERRPVDRPVSDADDAFVDRTIEADERTEEPVVSKEARVTEEIGLRKEQQDRQETVSDTVRRTEVEVEDERDNNATSRPSGTTDRI